MVYKWKHMDIHPSLSKYDFSPLFSHICSCCEFDN